MAKKEALKSRKQRPRKHIIADQSVNHVERFIIDAGHTATRVDKDYGYDLIVITYSAAGYVQTGHIYLQLKASDRLKLNAEGTAFVFQLDRRDYDLWRDEPLPVFLVLYDAEKRKSYWLYMQNYFESHPTLSQKLKKASVRVHVPKRNLLNARAVEILRGKKDDVMRQVRTGGVRHV